VLGGGGALPAHSRCVCGAVPIPRWVPGTTGEGAVRVGRSDGAASHGTEVPNSVWADLFQEFGYRVDEVWRRP
jgi:hypothetical protein